MNQPERIFLGWEKPLAEAVAEALLREVRGAGSGERDKSAGIVDLGEHLVIVPSAFAGRLVQEELAKQAGALLLPQITTPNLFLASKSFLREDPDLAEAEEVAGKEAMQLAWVTVLTASDFDRSLYPALFQKDRQGPMTAEGALAFAHDLMQLRNELGVAARGLSFAETGTSDALHKLEGAEGQIERWKQLAEIETLYLIRLKELGLIDHNCHRQRVALSTDLPKGIQNLWLACVIDPQPLLQTALEQRIERAHVRVLIAADKEQAEAFTPWGRPQPTAWSKPMGTPWKDFGETVHVVNKPEDGLERLGELVRRFHTQTAAKKSSQLEVVGRLSVVPCDRELHPALISRELHALARGEADEPLIKTANPLGRRHSEHGIHHAIKALLDLADAPTFQNLRRCANHPGVAGRLGLTEIEIEEGAGGERRKIGWFRLQRLLDAVSSATPPQPLDETVTYAQAVPIDESLERRVLEQNKNIRLAGVALEAGLAVARELIGLNWRGLAERTLALAQPTGGAGLSEEEWNFARDISEAIEAALDALAQGSPETSALSAREVVRLALASAGAKSFRGDMDRTAVNLPGWMEVPWEPVPHLIIFGLTDELVPGTRHAHPFLPSGLRGALGLGLPTEQFANAAYALELVRRQRARVGRIDIIVPRHNSKGEGLRPSRLLMLSPESEGDYLVGTKERPGRLDHLLAAVRSTKPEPIWNIPEKQRLNPTWTLPADAEQATKRINRLKCSISATAFKTYLTDPADYWMKFALGMSESSHDAVELDAAGFGNLVHAAVEAFGEDETTRQERHADKIQSALESKLDAYFRARFGSRPGGSLLMQREMARARLAAFSHSQAQLREEGWSIIEVEGALPEVEIISGFTLRGRFDRLDANAERTRFRVYDYKSFATAKNPLGTHVQTRKPFRGIALGDFEIPSRAKEAKGKMLMRRWKDLQLPAYDRALSLGRKEIGATTLEIGYLCLSGEANPAVIQIWEDYTETYRDKAWACMDAVAGALLTGGSEQFQPADRPSPYPVLAHLGSHSAESYLNLSKLGTNEYERK